MGLIYYSRSLERTLSSMNMHGPGICRPSPGARLLSSEACQGPMGTGGASCGPSSKTPAETLKLQLHAATWVALWTFIHLAFSEEEANAAKLLLTRLHPHRPFFHSNCCQVEHTVQKLQPKGRGSYLVTKRTFRGC